MNKTIFTLITLLAFAPDAQGVITLHLGEKFTIEADKGFNDIKHPYEILLVKKETQFKFSWKQGISRDKCLLTFQMRDRKKDAPHTMWYSHPDVIVLKYPEQPDQVIFLQLINEHKQ
jgi:hypothetical protein